jgi:hypothetical protein
MTWDSSVIRDKAREFDVAIFRKKMTAYVDEAWRDFEARRPIN